MTRSKTETSRVRNIYGNAVTPAFPLARHTFMGTAFPCKNIYGNSVPMRSRSTTPLVVAAIMTGGHHCGYDHLLSNSPWWMAREKQRPAGNSGCHIGVQNVKFDNASVQTGSVCYMVPSVSATV